jgi:putative ABC transport system permease protein
MASSRESEPFAVRWYRRLLHLYPAEYRETYGRELCLVLSDRRRDESSLAGRLAVWIHAAVGVLVDAPRQHGHALAQDTRGALRYMRKDATTALAAVAVLALGIGSATVVFSFANGLFLRPLPYPHASQLVAIDEWSPKDPNEHGEISAPNFADFRSRSHLVAEMGLWNSDDVSIRDGAAFRVRAGMVTAGIFPVFGVQPILGRWLTAEEDTPNGPRAVVISEELWRDHYGSAPDILRRNLNTGNNVYRIVGVMPAGFHFPDRALAWFAMRLDFATTPRTDYGLGAVGRLAPGASVVTATAEMDSLLAGIHGEHPEADNGWHARVQSFHQSITAEYRPALTLLLIGAGLLLVIACANVSNLLLATASARMREMAVRRALGASRRRLIRQVIVESLVLGLTGAVPGVLIAYLAVPALMSLVPVDLPQWMNFAVDARVLAFAVGVSLVTALVFGLAPSLTASAGDLVSMLRDGDRGGTGRAWQRRWREGWVIAQVALSVLLLIGAGLMVRSFVALRFQPLGYDAERVLAMTIDYPAKKYADGGPGRALIADLHSRLASLPGVTSVAFGTGVPLANGWSRYFTIEGRPLPLNETPFVNHTVITPGYFQTLGIPIVRGRDITDADYQAPHVVLVTQSFADQHWPGENAVGKRVRFGPPQNNEPWHEVIGIVGNNRVGALTDTDRPTVYLPFGSYDGTVPGDIVVRAATDPAALERAARERITGLDQSIAVSNVATLGRIVERVSWRDRFVAWLVGVFAVTALVLSAVGLYGALSYTVTQQRREIGIRMALGASRPLMRRLLVRRGLTLTAIGLAIGLGSAFAATRLLRAELYHVSTTDGVTFALAPALLLIAGWLASARPAWRATRVDPLHALRQN